MARLAAAAAILILAAVLRWIGLGTDLWLDELWSRRVALGMKSAFDAFSLHHEINHHLNTIWIYLMGPDGAAWLYRLPSFVAGVGVVAVAGFVGERLSRATGLIAMLLAACSYQLIVFSSEARGYSVAILCTLLSFLLLDRYFERPRWSAGVAYIATTVIGLFSQPMFASVLAAACLWSAWRWVDHKPRSGATALRILGIQAIPLLAFASVYFADLRHVIPGGGTASTSLIDVYGQSFAWAVGVTGSAPLLLVGCVLAVAAVSAGLRELTRRAEGQWVFFTGAVVVFPILLVILRDSPLIYTRHFVLGGTLALMLLAVVLGAWWARGMFGRAAVAAALIGFGIANGLHWRAFAEKGRGHYREAIQFMAAQTPGRPLTIGGDQDFRIATELDYYMPKLLGDRGGQYVRDGHWPPGGPMWVIANADHYEAAVLPHNIYRDASGNEYEYVRTFETAPLSGLHWFLFRNRAVR